MPLSKHHMLLVSQLVNLQTTTYLNFTVNTLLIGAKYVALIVNQLHIPNST